MTDKVISGLAIPLAKDNIDTDQIAPSSQLSILTGNDKPNWSQALFASWRFRASGVPKPDFILNRSPWLEGSILVTGDNFGCGSSREWAVTAIKDFGIQAIIAEGFAGIFYDNCFRNQLLPVMLDKATIRRMIPDIDRPSRPIRISIDIKAMLIQSEEGFSVKFSMPDFIRQIFMESLSVSDIIKSKLNEREEFDRKDRRLRPWVYPPSIDT